MTAALCSRRIRDAYFVHCILFDESGPYIAYDHPREIGEFVTEFLLKAVPNALVTD